MHVWPNRLDDPEGHFRMPKTMNEWMNEWIWYNHWMHQSTWRPRGEGADPGDSDRAKYRCQKSPPRAKIPCQNPGGQKSFFLPFLIKSSDFALGGGRKCRQKSPPRGKICRQMPRGCPPSPRGITLTGALSSITKVLIAEGSYCLLSEQDRIWM